MRIAIWLPALGALSLVVVLAHVVQPGGGAVPPRLREAMDVAHVIGFAAVAWLLVDRSLRYAEARGLPVWRLVAAAIVFTAVLAVMSEGAQTFVQREASLHDLLRDAGGIAGGALFGLALRTRIRPRAAWLVVASSVLVAAMWQPGRVVVAAAIAQTRLPELIGFESALDRELFLGYESTATRKPVPANWPLPGYLAEVDPIGTGFAGIAFLRLSADWSGYSSVSFLVASRDPGPNRVTIRIHDRRHDNRYEDRFNREFEIDQTPRRIRIPLDEVAQAPVDRELDLAHIEQVIVFVIASESGGGAFLFDDLRLE